MAISKLVFVLVGVGIFLLSLSSVQSQSSDNKAPKAGEAKAKAGKWYDTTLRRQTLNWRIESAYGPDMQLTKDRVFRLGSFAVRASVRSGEKGEEESAPQPDSNHFQRWNLTLEGAENSLWEVPEKGGSHSFKSGDESLSIAVYYDKLGRANVQPSKAYIATIANHQLIFIDRNFNGRYDDELIDGVIFGKGRYVFPYSWRIPLLKVVVFTEFTEKDDRLQLRYRKSPLVTKGDAARLHATLNSLRMHFGLFPTLSDKEWNKHCAAHCKYMKVNNEFTHHENPENKGFTRQGHIAGMSSIMAKGTMAANHAVYSLWDTPLHGFDVRSPYFSKAAYGALRPYSVIRSQGMTHRRFAFGRAWAFPPNGATNIPIEWPGKETPEPRLDTKKYYGYPITFYTEWGLLGMNQMQANKADPTEKLKPVSRPRIMDAKATLEEWTDKGWKAIEAQHTFDRNTAPPALKAWPWVHHYLLPKDKLSAFTLHRITLTWTGSDGKDAFYESTFTTGEDRGGHEWDIEQKGG